MTYLFSVVVAASLCRGAQRLATRTATQRRGYNPADALSAYLSDPSDAKTHTKLIAHCTATAISAF